MLLQHGSYIRKLLSALITTTCSQSEWTWGIGSKHGVMSIGGMSSLWLSLLLFYGVNYMIEGRKYCVSMAKMNVQYFGGMEKENSLRDSKIN